jgi:hypothetical protein
LSDFTPTRNLDEAARKQGEMQQRREERKTGPSKPHEHKFKEVPNPSNQKGGPFEGERKFKCVGAGPCPYKQQYLITGR